MAIPISITTTIWIEISEERLTANFRAIEQAVGAETSVLAVVKANAYGHGIELCSPALARAGAPWLGVTGASEGARARRALAEAGIAPAAPARDSADVRFHAAGRGGARRARSDPGRMDSTAGGLVGRLRPRRPRRGGHGDGAAGVHPGAELEDLLAEIEAAELPLDGLLTHFCAAEAAHSELTQTQQRRFESAIAQLRQQGLAPRWVHAGSSSSVDNPAQSTPWLVDLARSVGARAMVSLRLRALRLLRPHQSVRTRPPCIRSCAPRFVPS